MKKALSIVAGLLMLLMTSNAFGAAAGACAITDRDSKRGQDVVKYTWEWTSSAGGVVSELGATKISGVIIGVQFVWVDATALYDVVLLETDGSADVLEGVGANLAQATTNRTPITTDERLVPLVNSTLTPGVTNAGNAATGSIILFVLE